MLTPRARAEELLLDYGVSAPEDIDLDAIALDLGAEVRRAPLNGHEARIVGVGDRAVIWVDSSKSHRRQRFSLGHELGHWLLHRGSVLYCASSDIGSDRARDAERMANHFAADLLMPWFLFTSALESFGSASWEAVAHLSKAFETSRPATALRLIHSDRFPAILVCTHASGRRWFQRAASVPDVWYVKNELDPRTTAFEVLYGTADGTRSKTISASAWFERRDANRFQVREQSVRSEQEVYTLLSFVEREALRR